jgi:hypothetical protein
MLKVLPAVANFEGASETTDGATQAMLDTIGDNGQSRIEGMRRGFEQWRQEMAGSEGPLGNVAVGLSAFGAQGLMAAGAAGQVAAGLAAVRVGSLATAAATAASTTASVAARAASLAWAAAQWVLNAALAANPIGLVIAAIAALVAAIVIAYKRSETFRRIVQAAFDGTKAAAVALWHGAQRAFNGLSTAAVTLWNGLKRVFGAGKDAIVGYARLVTAPYRAAFAGIRAAWNATVGGKGFTVPGWIPGVGGKSFRIPYFAAGGISPGGLAIVGERGRELVDLPPGSRIRNNGATERALAGAGQPAGPFVVMLEIGGRRIGELLVDPIRQTVRAKGQGVTASLGPGRAPGTGLA